MNAVYPPGPPDPTRPADRTAQLFNLGGTLAATARGDGALALITGEAGIGKTTFALELTAHATALGLRAHWSACSVRSAERPYWPWSQLIQSHLAAVTPREMPPLMEAIAPALGVLDPDLAARFGASEPAWRADDQFALFQTVARFWSIAAVREQPLLLVLDDIQWIDLPSLQLLAHLATTLRRSPVGLVATIRTGEPLTEDTAAGLAQLDRCVPIMVSLDGLPRIMLGELIRARGLAPRVGLVELLADRTAGNAFFATELLRALDPSADLSSSVATLAETIPANVSRSVRRRVGLLDNAVADLLGAAAVVGPRGDLATLAATAEVDLPSATQRLATLADAGLVVQGGGTGWRFTHTIVRDVVYQGLPDALRRSSHERALAALEASGAPLAQLAWQAPYLAEVGDGSRAVTLLVEAGAEHLNRHAYAAAAHCFTRAVAWGPAGTPAQASRLLLLAAAYRGLGYTVQAQAAFRAAVSASADDPVPLGTATLGFVDPMVSSDTPRPGGSDELLGDALAALGAAETPLRVRLLARLGVECFSAGDLDRSRLVVAEAMAMARRLGDAVALVSAMDAHHDLRIADRVPLAATLAESEEMLTLARTAEDARTLRAAHGARVLDLVTAGDLSAADAELAELSRSTTALGDVPGDLWLVLVWRAMRALLDGHHIEAAAFAARAWEIAEPIGRPEADSTWLIQATFIRHEQARLSEVGADIEAFVSRKPYSPAIDTLAAFKAAELGSRDEAADALRRLASQLTKVPQDRNWPGTWFQLARIAFLVHDESVAAELYGAGQWLAGRCVVIGLGAVCVGAADLALAWLADTVGDGAQARRWYTTAEETNVRVDARSWLARTRLDHAGMLARRSGSDDLAEAIRLATSAADAATRIGLVPVLDGAEALLAAMKAVVGASARGDISDSSKRTAATGQGVFSRQGTVWELRYAGQSIRLPHAKGLTDLSQLLSRPGQPMHVSDLVALQAAGARPPSGADEVFDARARQEIRRRLADLQTEADDAEDDADLARAERARTERAEILAGLSSALGLGGRARRLNDPMERARKTVSARIRSSINHIRADHPQLARHLETSVDTGLWCVYRSEQPMVWKA